MKATVSGIVEDLKSKISEGSDQNSAKLRKLSNWAESEKHQFQS